jgi:hypothetical protein
MLPSGASFEPGSPPALRRFTNRSRASILAQVHKHPHNWRSHDNARFELTTTPASTLAQVRRLCGDSLTANLASERRQNALVRPYSCLKSGGLYLRMSQFGSAFRNSSTPASVTFVPRRNKTCKLFSPASSFSPASVIFVSPQVQPLQVLQSGQFLQPRVGYLREGQVQLCRFFSPASSFSPASVICVWLRLQPLQVLQSGQFLQPRVRYLRAARSSVCRFFSAASSFSPASVICVPFQVQPFAGSSVRPVPSAPRRLSACPTGSAIAGSSVPPVPSAPRRLSA